MLVIRFSAWNIYRMWPIVHSPTLSAYDLYCGYRNCHIVIPGTNSTDILIYVNQPYTSTQRMSFLGKCVTNTTVNNYLNVPKKLDTN